MGPAGQPLHWAARAARTSIAIALASGLWSPAASALGAVPASTARVSAACDAETPRRGRLLVAQRQLQDPNFVKSVVLLLESDASGAVGVVVNRPSRIDLRKLLPDLEPGADHPEHLFLGGPVGRFQLLLLVRSSSPPAESLRVFADVYVTASREALQQALRAKDSSARYRLFAVYAGWAPGQLEAEIARGGWRLVDGDAERVFASDRGRVWDELMEREEGRWVRRGLGDEPMAWGVAGSGR